MKPTDTSRRRMLGVLASAPLAASVLVASATANARVKTSARIVIVGSGAVGVSVANRLHRELDGARITIIDGREV